MTTQATMPTTNQLAIFEAMPATRTIPYVGLGDLPTPVERLRQLEDSTDIGALWVKRDDESGTVYGGNKVRKLEFLLAEAQAEGHREVWTVGAIGSHHALATSIYARQLGLTPAVLHFPQPLTDHVLDNLRAISTTGPKLTLAGNKLELPVEVIKSKMRQWLSSSNDVYHIPSGGSSPTGALGYVNAAFELRDQIDAGQADEPDYIFVAAGTCGTMAGLMVGAKLAGLRTEIVGVRVVDKVVCNAVVAARLANQTSKRLAEAGVEGVPHFSTSDVTMLDAYFGSDYGVPTDAGRAAIDRCSSAADLTLEPTYTAKAFAGLLGERQRLGLADKKVLYWHTLSSADLTDRIDSADVFQDLPEPYHRFFEDLS